MMKDADVTVHLDTDYVMRMPSLKLTNFSSYVLVGAKSMSGSILFVVLSSLDSASSLICLKYNSLVGWLAASSFG